jgi:hypothetical protein
VSRRKKAAARTKCQAAGFPGTYICVSFPGFAFGDLQPGKGKKRVMHGIFEPARAVERQAAKGDGGKWPRLFDVMIGTCSMYLRMRPSSIRPLAVCQLLRWGE